MPVFKGTEASLLCWCVFCFVGVVEWTEMRCQNVRSSIIAEVNKDGGRRFVPSSKTSSEHVFSLNKWLFNSSCVWFLKTCEVLHHLYTKNCWRLFGVGAEIPETDIAMESDRQTRMPAGLHFFFSSWNFFADPNFFFCFRNLGGVG